MAVENPRDIGVAQIISPVSAEGLGQESITVRIKNYADIPVDGFDVCYTSTPRERYVITAYTLSSGDIADTNDSASATVVHMAPATVPYSRTGAGFLAYNYNKENDGDDWVFIDPLEVEAGKLLVKFWYSATENHTERMRVCWGDAPVPEAMTNVLVDLDNISNDTFMESASLIEIPAAQKIYIGFYCYSAKDENWLIVDDLSIEYVDPSSFDVSAGDFSGVNDFYRVNNRRYVTVAVVNQGITENTIGVKLSVDGKEVASQEVTVNILSKKDVTFENALAGLGDGRHIMKAEASHPSDNNFDNNTRDGGMLRISGEFSRGAIYTAGGVKVMDITTPTADISSLGHGLYIINIDGRGIKLAL